MKAVLALPAAAALLAWPPRAAAQAPDATAADTGAAMAGFMLVLRRNVQSTCNRPATGRQR